MQLLQRRSGDICGARGSSDVSLNSNSGHPDFRFPITHYPPGWLSCNQECSAQMQSLSLENG